MSCAKCIKCIRQWVSFLSLVHPSQLGINIINENFASEIRFYFKIKCYRSISKSVMFGSNCWTPWQFRGSMQPWEFRGKEPAKAGVQNGHPFLPGAPLWNPRASWGFVHVRIQTLCLS